MSVSQATVSANPARALSNSRRLTVSARSRYLCVYIASVCVCVCASVCVHVCVRVRVCVHSHIETLRRLTFSYTHPFGCACVRACECVCVYVCIGACACVALCLCVYGVRMCKGVAALCVFMCVCVCVSSTIGIYSGLVFFDVYM